MKSPKKYPTIAEASRATAVSPASLRKWRDVEGIDVLNPKQLAKRVELKQVKIDGSAAPAPATGAPESYSEARRRRAVADANRAELIAKRESGELVSLAVVTGTFERIGYLFRSILNRELGILPGELCGLSSPQIQKKLKARFHDILLEISQTDPATITPPADFADLDRDKR